MYLAQLVYGFLMGETSVQQCMLRLEISYAGHVQPG